MSKKSSKSKVVSKSKPINHTREHNEFYNCFTIESITQDINFLNYLYDDKTGLKSENVDQDFIFELKSIAKDLYFFINSLEASLSPQNYIKRKDQFIKNSIPNGSRDLFFLAWNGLIKNDSFKRVLLKKFSLKPFNDQLCPQDIPNFGSTTTRYRTKSIVADDMAKDQYGKRRSEGRELDDGSGLSMREGIVWLPNGKALPIYPLAYVPLNQTQLIVIRHGRSKHESGGENPEFVGSGYMDNWEFNRRVSGAIGNILHDDGIETAKELGKDFKVASDKLAKDGFPLWSWSKDTPVSVFGSESENTEQTARYFLSEAGYTNITFNASYGLNSQKYGKLTHRFKKDVIAKMAEIYMGNFGNDIEEAKKGIKKHLKNRFFHYPEGETLIEADWRISHSFLDLLKKNQGKRVVLCDHSGALRVFAAIIKTLDFADYSTIKEAQDSIIALTYQQGMNVRYDYLQKSSFPLREKKKNESDVKRS